MLNPSLRAREDRNALIVGILDGTIDIIATDHAPHTMKEKTRGIEKSSFGIVGSETAFAQLYTKFVKTNILSLELGVLSDSHLSQGSGGCQDRVGGGGPGAQGGRHAEDRCRQTPGGQRLQVRIVAFPAPPQAPLTESGSPCSPFS